MYFEVGGTELEVLCRGSTSRVRRLIEGEALAIAELVVGMRGDNIEGAGGLMRSDEKKRVLKLKLKIQSPRGMTDRGVKQSVSGA